MRERDSVGRTFRQPQYGNAGSVSTLGKHFLTASDGSQALCNSRFRNRKIHSRRKMSAEQCLMSGFFDLTCRTSQVVLKQKRHPLGFNGLYRPPPPRQERAPIRDLDTRPDLAMHRCFAFNCLDMWCHVEWLSVRAQKRQWL